jgi:hypothetical protein
MRRTRRRRGINYPNELAQVLEMLFDQRVRDSGGWKVRSTKAYVKVLQTVVDDYVFWEQVQTLINAAKPLSCKLTN